MPTHMPDDRPIRAPADMKPADMPSADMPSADVPPSDIKPDNAPGIDILVESPLWDAFPAAETTIRTAIAACVAQLSVSTDGAEVAIMLCDDSGIRSLNRDWRGLDKPTNVLSFPAAPPPHLEPGAPRLLGDIAIAFETLEREAKDEGKPFAHHLSHLAAHGFLHLLGFDHENDADAERMEQLETRILATLNIPDPYAESDA